MNLNHNILKIEWLIKKKYSLTSIPPPGPSSVHLRFPDEVSQIWISPSKLPDASNCPSALNAKLDTESLWPAAVSLESVRKRLTDIRSDMLILDLAKGKKVELVIRKHDIILLDVKSETKKIYDYLQYHAHTTKLLCKISSANLPHKSFVISTTCCN